MKPQTYGAFFLYLCGAIASGGSGYLVGVAVGYDVAVEENKKYHDKYEKTDCACGATQTCPFGEGIVGQQRCKTTEYGNTWSRCEPRLP